MEQALLRLNSQDTETIEAALIDDLLADPPNGLEQVDAAILISRGRYFYKRRLDTHPPTYRYKCLSPDALQVAFNTQTIDSGWIAPGVVRCGASTQGSWAVQFIPPARHRLDLDRLGKVSVPLPGLLFLGLETTYWLCATTTQTFDPAALCYYAPLSNVYDSLKICWGRNIPPIATAQTIATAWELFITSPFNEHLSYGKSRQHPQNIQTQLLALHQRSGRRYPAKDLLPVNSRPITVDHLVQELLIREPSST